MDIDINVHFLSDILVNHKMENKKNQKIRNGKRNYYIKGKDIFAFFLVVVGICSVFFISFLNKKYKGINTLSTSVVDETGKMYISTPEELVAFSDRVNSGETFTGVHVMLSSDLDMSSVGEFRPIGVYESEHYFYGVFDGQGHTIKNLQITTLEGKENSGLFGTLAGSVCNLIIEDSYVKGSACGAFCSIAIGENSILYNCQAKNVTIDAPYTDIIGGQYLGKKANCVVDNEGNPDELNQNLISLSSKTHFIPMNEWVMENGNLTLSKEKTRVASDMYVHIDNNAYFGNIYPFFKEGIYYFVMPFEKVSGLVTLNVKDQNGKELSYVIDNPDEETFETNMNISDEKEDYQVKICFTKNVGSVFIDTKLRWGMDYLKGSKLNLTTGTIQVVDENGKANFKGGMERFQGRGNDSWLCEKKGFSIDLIEDANLLDLGSDKDYALVAGYRDSSLLSYMVIKDLINEMNFEYAPDYKFVNFYANGEYQGLYVLTEKINVGYNRINIDCTYRDVSGGYLYELDDLDYNWELNYFHTDYGNTYVINDPLIVKNRQMEYSQNLWQELEHAIYSPTGYNEQGKYYTDYIDLDSLAKIWLFYELNGEYSVSSSVNFYKDSDRMGDGKIHALYPWDVEHAFAREDYMTIDVMNTVNADGTNGFWPAVYQHEDLQKAVFENWVNLFRPAVEKLIDPATGEQEKGVSYIGTYGKKYEVASKWNEVLWGEDQSISLKGEKIEEWMKVRMPYLDQSLIPKQ